MKKIKFKLNKKRKIVLVIVALLVIFFSLVITLGRYVYDIYQNHILESKGFYFNSNVMSSKGTKHSINNWDGVNAYQITIDVNNRKNEYVWSKNDITYEINVECSDSIRCVLNKEEGIIYSDSKDDNFTITIYPIGNFSTNQSAEVKVKAKSTSPYIKELSATYSIGIETSKFSYKIIDSVGEKYITLELTNAFTYYKVISAFDTYKVGDNVIIDDYMKLSEDQKKKCLSVKVTLNFNPNDVVLDMTDKTYLQRDTSGDGTTNIGGFEYVNSFQFDMEANSTKKIIFYKKDTSKNFTYPGSNPIVDVSIYSVEDM